MIRTSGSGFPAPAACSCGTSLVEAPVAAVRCRQVHDLAPIPAPVVIEYAAQVKCCPGCRVTVTGAFPAGVNAAPVQYGPEITTRVADVVVGHHVPVHRSTVLVAELLGMQVSTGFAASLRGRAARLISDGGFGDAVKKLRTKAPVVHADETFARAAGTTAYVHVACTEHLTLLHTGNRSAEAIDAGGVLTELGAGQVLVRDGYAGYTHLKDVAHAWCAAHLLRDLRGISEAEDPAGQLWPRRWPTPSSRPTGSHPPPARPGGRHCPKRNCAPSPASTPAPWPGPAPTTPPATRPSWPATPAPSPPGSRPTAR